MVICLFVFVVVFGFLVFGFLLLLLLFSSFFAKKIKYNLT